MHKGFSSQIKKPPTIICGRLKAGNLIIFWVIFFSIVRSCINAGFNQRLGTFASNLSVNAPSFQPFLSSSHFNKSGRRFILVATPIANSWST
jgi:hypothetical protein